MIRYPKFQMKTLSQLQTDLLKQGFFLTQPENRKTGDRYFTNLDEQYAQITGTGIRKLFYMNVLNADGPDFTTHSIKMESISVVI